MLRTSSVLRGAVAGVLLVALLALLLPLVSFGQAAPGAPPPAVIDINAGDRTSCAIWEDGAISCWGERMGVPERGNYQQVSTAGQYTCGVRTGGSLACWQLDAFAYNPPPAGSFKYVSVGYRYGCGIRADDTLSCWSGFAGRPVAAPPAGTFLSIDGTCGVRSDHTLACWSVEDTVVPVPVSGTFSQVAVGGDHTCGLRVGGSLACWGANDEGQASPPAGFFRAVSAGDRFTCGIRLDRSVVCWGMQLDGTGKPPAGSFSQISAGSSHACGIRLDGAIVCWGNNAAGQARPINRTRAAPAFLVKDINLGGDVRCGYSNSCIFAATTAGGRLFFAATDGRGESHEWLQSDGSYAGTLFTGIKTMTRAVGLNDRLVGVSLDAAYGSELALSDGGARIKDINPGPRSSLDYYDAARGFSYTSPLVVAGNLVFFGANDGASGFELWRTDGTAEGTVQVADLLPGPGSSFPTDLLARNGKLYFVASGGAGPTLWQSDGTTGGTRPLIREPLALRLSEPAQPTLVAGEIFFAARTAEHGYSLWKSDGSAAGTALVYDPLPGAAGEPLTQLVGAPGRLFFVAADASGYALWVSDGTPGRAVRLTTPQPAYQNYVVTPVGNRVFFVAGGTLWVSDGTSAGTRPVTGAPLRVDFPGAFPPRLTVVGDAVLFAASDGAHGRELWISDGSAAGTRMVQDINPGPADSRPALLGVTDDYVFFSADDGRRGSELWAMPPPTRTFLPLLGRRANP